MSTEEAKQDMERCEAAEQEEIMEDSEKKVGDQVQSTEVAAGMPEDMKGAKGPTDPDYLAQPTPEDDSDYELSPTDQSALAESLLEEAEEDIPDGELNEVSAYTEPGTIQHGETKQYRMKNNRVVRPLKYTYIAMTDMQRTRYGEKITKSQSLTKIREVSYAALVHHVQTLDIEGFNPSSALSWSHIRPSAIIEEILDAVTGKVAIEGADLKNLLGG